MSNSSYFTKTTEGDRMKRGEMAVNVSGAVLASLFYDNSAIEGDHSGFLIGSVLNHVTDTISDSQINNVEVETKIQIYECIPCPRDQRFYTVCGQIQQHHVNNLLKEKQKNIVGWYSFRRNSTLRPSYKERLLHQNLSKLAGDNENMFTFLLCSAKSSTNKSTISFDHTFLQLTNNVFRRLPVTVVNLGDTTHTEYRHLPSHTVSATTGIYSLLVEQQEDSFLNRHGQMDVQGIQALNGALNRKLQEMADHVVVSESKLCELEVEIRQYRQTVRVRQLEKLQASKPPGDRTDTAVKAGHSAADSVDSLLEHNGLVSLQIKKDLSVDELLSMDYNDDNLKPQKGQGHIDDISGKGQQSGQTFSKTTGAKLKLGSLSKATSQSSAKNVNSLDSKTTEVRLTSPVSLHKRSGSSVDKTMSSNLDPAIVHTRSKSNDVGDTNHVKVEDKKSSDPFEFVSSIIAGSKKDEKLNSFMDVEKGKEIKMPSHKLESSISNDNKVHGAVKSADVQRKNSNRGTDAALSAAGNFNQNTRTRGQRSHKGHESDHEESRSQEDHENDFEIEGEMDVENGLDSIGKSKGKIGKSKVKNCAQEAGKKGQSSQDSEDTMTSQDTYEMDVSSSPVY